MLLIAGFVFPPLWLALTGYLIYIFASKRSRRDDAIEKRIRAMIANGNDFATFNDIYFDAAKSYAAEKGSRSDDPAIAIAKIVIDHVVYRVSFMRSRVGGTEIHLESDEKFTSFVKTIEDQIYEKNNNEKGESVEIAPATDFASVDEDIIEVFMVKLIRSGHMLLNRRDLDFEKIKSYALSRCGREHGNSSVVLRIIVLGKPYRFKFDLADGWISTFAVEISDQSIPGSGYPVISLGKNYEQDKPRFENYFKHMGEPTCRGADNDDPPSNLEEAVNPHNFSILKGILHEKKGERRPHYARPEWAYYEENLGRFLHKVADEASILAVEDDFTSQFIGDPSGINCIMFCIYGRSTDVDHLSKIGAFVIKAFWERPDARVELLERWARVAS